MRWPYKLFLRLRSLLRKGRVEQELSEELCFHVEGLIHERVAKGMTPEEARYAALRELGGVEQIKEECRDMRRVNFIENLTQDVRYGLRTLCKNPGFAAVAILTLGLGIGANTAIFSAVNDVLLRPLPYPNSNQLVRVWATDTKSGANHDVASYPDFADWAAQSRSFQQIEAYAGRSYNLSGGDHPERIAGVRESAGLLRMLGMKPLLGRGFSVDEQMPGRSHLVLLSETLWRSHFGASTRILGATVKLDGENYTVIGVLPASPEFPPNERHDLVVPLELDPDRGHGFLNVIGRATPGVTLASAQAEMSTIESRLAKQYRQDRSVGVQLQLLQASYVSQYRPALLILWGAVGFVLLIACANVANLFLGRAAVRHREMAVRASLGAGRVRLIRQLLAEGVLVGLAGGALGLLLAFWGVEGLVTLLSRDFSIPYAGHIGVNRSVLALTLLVAILTGLLSGLAPALSASKVDLNESLKEGSRGLTGSLGRNRFRSALVISEFILALVLLSGAGLMIKSFVLLTQVDSGLRPENVLAMDFSLRGSQYSHTATRAAAFEEILSRVVALHGVQSAAVVADVPLTDNEDGFGFSIEGVPDAPGERREATFNVVGPDYFRTLGIPLAEGRDFTESDNASAPVAVVINQAMVHRFWPNQNPIGRRITTDGKTWYTIVGIAGDVRQLGLGSEPKPEVYLSYLQDPYQWPHLSMLVRASSQPLKLFPAIERAVWSVDKDVPVSNPMTMDQIRSDSIAQPRATALLLGCFAALALVLASIGLYSVVARSVLERTHEIGVRMALGAQCQEIFRLIVGQGMILALAGAALGLAAALGATRVLATLLFHVRPTDFMTLGAVSFLVVAVALLACYIAARRATQVDPMVALRYE
jgi:predicted permease